MAAASAKKKGLSIEEKVIKVEEWLTENPHPFTLKEMMTLIPKAKGVIPQSIEECLEVLVSENRVSSDRLGVTVMYWKFGPGDKNAQTPSGKGGSPPEPSKDPIQMIEELAATLTTRAELDAAIEAAKEENAALDLHISERMAVVESPDEHTCTDQRLKDLSTQLRDVLRQLEAFSDRDPAVAEQLEASCRSAVEAVNRWTENMYILLEYVARRLSCTRNDAMIRCFGRVLEEAELEFIDYATSSVAVSSTASACAS